MPLCVTNSGLNPKWIAPADPARFHSGNKPEFDLRRTSLSAVRSATLLHLAQTIKSTEHLADVAQLVEQPIRNRQVTGSSPVVGSRFPCPRDSQSGEAFPKYLPLQNPFTKPLNLLVFFRLVWKNEASEKFTPQVIR